MNQESIDHSLLSMLHIRLSTAIKYFGKGV